jgi:uncharacterized membrane protein
VTAIRVLDSAALGLAVALLSTLLYWWARPEIVFLALLATVAARLVVGPMAVPAWAPRRVLVAGIVGYSLAFSFVTVTRHLNFLTHALDLGYYVQLTWSLATGRGPRVSLPEMHAWGDHLSPIMYAFAPLFWLAPGPLTLLIAQSSALALGALAVFGIARQRLGDERPAAAFALLYLLNPSLHGINVRDFHAAALAVPCLLAAMWAAHAERFGLFTVASLLALMCREDAALAVMGLGAWLAVGRRQWRVGVVVAATALAVLIVDIRWVSPQFRGEPYPHLGRYARLGGSLGEIVSAALLHPSRVLSIVLTGDRLVYLLALTAPLAFLPLLAPAELMPALPALAQNLLASDPTLYNHRTQYQAFIVPFLIVAAIGGYARTSHVASRWRVAILTVAAVGSLALAARAVTNFALARWWPAPASRAAYRVLSQVPARAAVSAQDPYVAHLSLRPLVFVFPEGIDRSEYVVLNISTYPWRKQPGVILQREDRAVSLLMPDGRAHRYAVVSEAGPHLLLRRELSPQFRTIVPEAQTFGVKRRLAPRASGGGRAERTAAGVGS